MNTREPREELAQLAAQVRAYVEWQRDTGAVGFPRKPRVAPSLVEDAVIARESSRSSSFEPPRPPLRDDAWLDVTPLELGNGAVSERFPSPMAAAVAVPPAAVATASLRTLSVLRTEATTCSKCALAATRGQVVFERGNPKAPLCFVGEAPGAEEDAQGVPFVGRAGQLLDKMISAMGLNPVTDVYICNIIKCRPPENRKPEPLEVATCIPYLHEQLELVTPKVIVTLGNTAVAGLFGTKLGITKLRGQWKLYRGKIPVMPTYHPSYLLRPSAQQVEAKKQAWEDLQAVMRELARG